jgi:uncharacterized membrane protein YcaP (DUF421 family)
VHLIAGSFNDILQSQIPIWDKVLRTVAVYALIYILMRLAKRDAAQLTASDFVVVLLLSNVVQNAIIGPDNSLVGGAVGAVTLIVANELVARWEWARKMRRADRSQQEERERKPSPEPTGMLSSFWATRTDPVLLIDDGEVQEWALRGLGISQLDLFAELRRQGVGDPGDDVEWAELRTGGAIDYKLKALAEAATKGDMDDLHRELRELRDAVGRLSSSG